jgi:hypothetical protein
MSSLAVGPIQVLRKSPPPALKTGHSFSDDDSDSFIEFETEVLYARIEELEKKKNFYKIKLQQVKQLVVFHFDDAEKMKDGILKVLSKVDFKKKKARKKSISDTEIKNAIAKIVIVD